jgi:hypothetical protein
MNIAVHLPLLHMCSLLAPRQLEQQHSMEALIAGSTCRAGGEAAQQLLPPACAAAARLGKHRHNAHHPHSTYLCKAAHSTSRKHHSSWR